MRYWFFKGFGKEVYIELNHFNAPSNFEKHLEGTDIEVWLFKRLYVIMCDIKANEESLKNKA